MYVQHSETDSAVIIVNRLRIERPENRSSIPDCSEIFPSLLKVQTRSGANPDIYRMRTGDYSTGVKRGGREAEHLPPSSDVACIV